MARRKSRSFMEVSSQAVALEEPDFCAEEWPAAVYARLSLENSGRDDHGESIEGQVEICRDYIDEHPYLRFVDTYVDNGWTGTNMDRPQFQRLLDDIRKGRIKAIVIKDFSRFSRDYIEAGNLLENVFPALGVRFISVADRYDSLETDGSADSLLIPIKNLINSFYARDISRKVSSAVHARQLAASYLPGNIPYGYIKSTTREYRLEPDPETAHNVTRIFQMFTDGVPCTTIASTLESEGIPSPGRVRWMRGQTSDITYKTCPWGDSYIRMMLRNPTYLGHLVFGRMPSALYLGKRGPRYEPDESKWRVLRDMHEPLVTQEIFDQAKAIMEKGRTEIVAARAKTAEYRTQNVPLFNNVLFCGDCGRKICYTREMYRPERLIGRYYCTNKRMHGSFTSISQEKLKGIVWQAVKDQIAICCDYDSAIRKLQSGATTAQMEEYRARIQSLGLQVKGRRDRLGHLYEDFVDGLLSPEDYMLMKKKFESEYRQFSSELTEIQGRLTRLKKSLSGENRWLIHIREFSDAEEFRKDMLDALVEKILIYHDPDGSLRVEILFRYAADRDLLIEACREMGGEKP